MLGPNHFNFDFTDSTGSAAAPAAPAAPNRERTYSAPSNLSPTNQGQNNGVANVQAAPAQDQPQPVQTPANSSIPRLLADVPTPLVDAADATEVTHCVSCMGVATDPVSVCAEEHIFCRSCSFKWLQQGKTTCPTCRQPTVPFGGQRLSRCLERIYNETQVACPFDDCAWFGTMGNYRGANGHGLECLLRTSEIERLQTENAHLRSLNEQLQSQVHSLRLNVETIYHSSQVEIQNLAQQNASLRERINQISGGRVLH